MLNHEGKENGIISRTSAIPQSTRNVFFGTLLIARARMTVTAKIITAPVKLIWSRFIITTSFQIANNLFQLFDLFLRQFFSPKQRSEQFVSRTVVDFVDQFISFGFLNSGLGNQCMADRKSVV